jgi:menaquinone-9 beta-reductase
MTELRVNVLIIGAGPGGAAAAITLAKKGIAVMLVDKAKFGRDKTCGDALIPDAFEALKQVGCLDQVMKLAHSVSLFKIYAPNRMTVNIQGQLGSLPRQILDQLLVNRAIEYGAEYRTETSFISLIERANRVVGARFLDYKGSEFSVLSDYVLLATGANSDALLKSGMCTRKSASGMALRAYFKLPPGLAAEMNHFAISFAGNVGPGYGWVFAGPDSVFNVGVGYFQDSWRKPQTANLREVWSSFLESFEPASRIHKYSKLLGMEKGAPLRTALAGSKFARPGLLLVGEALGTTYSFSGEGIGKAMQTGIMAAECIGAFIEPIEEEYVKLIRRKFSDQYAAYRMAQDWLSFPSVCNLMAIRANKGEYVRKQFEGILAETSNPRELFSLRGILRGLTG